MSDLQWLSPTPDDLDRTVELLRICFPRPASLDRAFLQWCYYDNPHGPAVGWNVEHEGRLVGHLVASRSGCPARGGRPDRPACDVATHPTIAPRLVSRDRAKDPGARRRGRRRGRDRVANQQTYRAYEKHSGSRMSAGLDAHVEALPEAIDMRGALATAEWSRVWDDESLAWRLRNPHNPLSIAAATPQALIVEGASSMPLICARAQIPRIGLSASPPKAWPWPGVVLA